jgi:hypothetical protein
LRLIRRASSASTSTVSDSAWKSSSVAPFALASCAALRTAGMELGVDILDGDQDLLHGMHGTSTGRFFKRT